MRRQKTELGKTKSKTDTGNPKKKIVIWCNPLEEENLEKKIK
jgi:hypothetical protein